MKPDLEELLRESQARLAAKVPRRRRRLADHAWAALGLAVVVLLLLGAWWW